MKGGWLMFFVQDTAGHTGRFGTLDELKEYVEIRHAEEGGWDWISEIKDEHERQYGCSWQLEVERL